MSAALDPVAARPSWIAEPGEVIGGYEVKSLIAIGSTAHVFLAHHALLGRPAAVKVLSPELVSNPSVVARLLTEARIVNDIRHPNIVDIFDFVATQTPKRIALVMEHVDGPSLMQLRGHRFRFDQAIAIAIQLVEAVGAAHRAGVIHRDLKPGNLLLTAHPSESIGVPTLKLVDFGIAKLAQVAGRTATGMMLGTPAYMAPEQIACRPEPTPATDVYAIGEVLYELLAGRRVFAANAIHETVRAKLRGHLPELVLPHTVPERVAILDVVRACLARAPQDRPRLDEVRALLCRVYPETWRAPLTEGAQVVADSLPRVPAYREECTKPIVLDPHAAPTHAPSESDPGADAVTIPPRLVLDADIDVTDDALQVSAPVRPDLAALCGDLDIDETRTGEHCGLPPSLSAPTELELVIDTTNEDTAVRPFARTPNDVAWLVEEGERVWPEPVLEAPPIPARRSLGEATEIEHDDLLAAETEAAPYPSHQARTIVPAGVVLPTQPLELRLDPEEGPWEVASDRTRPDHDPAEVSAGLGAAHRTIADPATLRSAPWHLSRLALPPEPAAPTRPLPRVPTIPLPTIPRDRSWPMLVAIGLIFAGSVGGIVLALHGAV